jgi:hypothetical protein
MKLCKDCKYFQSNDSYTGFPLCTHVNAPVNPVWGHKDGSCQLMRSPNCLIANCGPDGDWFEPKQPQQN